MRSCEATRDGLEALHYGDLDAPERAELEAHLAECAGCRAALEAVRDMAASLDRMDVQAPSELEWARFEARLEARVAPLRARRFATKFLRWGRAARVAAAVLIGTLGALSLALYAETRKQAEQIAFLSRAAGDAAWDRGDVEGATRIYTAVAVTAKESTVSQRLAAASSVEDPRIAKMWAIARNETGEQECRKRIGELLATYPRHPLADQAFKALEKQGVPRLPDLADAVRKPVPLVSPRPLPGETPESHARAEVEKLRAAAQGKDAKAGGWAMFRAARLAEERLFDPALARTLYDEARRLAPSGPLHDDAEASVARIGPR